MFNEKILLNQIRVEICENKIMKKFVFEFLVIVVASKICRSDLHNNWGYTNALTMRNKETDYLYEKRGSLVCSCNSRFIYAFDYVLLHLTFIFPARNRVARSNRATIFFFPPFFPLRNYEDAQRVYTSVAQKLSAYKRVLLGRLKITALSHAFMRVALMSP